jgi:GT2 family glycosyltransferase
LARLLIVIVNYKTADLTVACLRSLAPEIAAVPGCYVVLVENASGEETVLREAIERNGWQSWAMLRIASRNGGFGAGNNVAIAPALASSDPPCFVLLLNSDTEVRPNALATMLRFMETHPEVGIAGTGIENPDGTIWPFAFRFMTPANQFLSGIRLGVLDRLFSNHLVARTMPQDRPASVDWVSGCSMIVRREVFQAIGLLDEGYFLYFDEVDFCLRARRAGWACWYVPQSRVMHIGGQSSGFFGVGGAQNRARVPLYWFDSRHRYFVKHFGALGALAADVAYSMGYACWRLRRLIQRKPDPDPPHMLADLWRHRLLGGQK